MKLKDFSRWHIWNDAKRVKNEGIRLNVRAELFVICEMFLMFLENSEGKVPINLFFSGKQLNIQLRAFTQQKN